MKTIVFVVLVLIGVTGCRQDDTAKEHIAAKHAEQVQKFKEYDKASFE